MGVAAGGLTVGGLGAAGVAVVCCEDACVHCWVRTDSSSARSGGCGCSDGCDGGLVIAS